MGVELPDDSLLQFREEDQQSEQLQFDLNLGQAITLVKASRGYDRYRS